MDSRLDAFKEMPFTGLPMENISRHQAEKRQRNQVMSNLFVIESALLKHLEDAYKKICDPMNSEIRRHIFKNRETIFMGFYVKCKHVAECTILARSIGHRLSDDEKKKLCEKHNENNKRITETLRKINEQFNVLAEQVAIENVVFTKEEEKGKNNVYLIYTRTKAQEVVKSLKRSCNRCLEGRREIMLKTVQVIERMINSSAKDPLTFHIENFDRNIAKYTSTNKFVSDFFDKVQIGYQELDVIRAQ